MNLSRRRFLFLATAGVGVLACGQPHDPVEVADRLVELAGSKEDWARIGRAYLQTDPPEADLARLTSELADTLDGPSFGTREELERRVARAIQADFAGGRLVEVGGWQLSLTEARLCAVTALHPAG